MAIKIVEQCQISPSHGGGGGAEQLILPLLHFDVVWLPIQPTQCLCFYGSPSSIQHFSDTILPHLKNSLSLTLKHFLPLAGKIVFPLNSGSMPLSHYSSTNNDSVTLTIAVSDSDFSLLTGNHSRDSDEFHDFNSQMPPALYSSDSVKFSAAAIRVTLFPNQGICIGLTNHHAICDGTSLLGPSGFMQTWASINNLELRGELEPDDSRLTLPTYDRSIVQDANTLTALFWNHVKLLKPAPYSTISLPTSKVRATFVLTDVEIQGWKRFLRNQNPAVAYVSSYVVVCSHVWSCLAASAAAAGEIVDGDEAEYISMYVDCRKRLKPPLPESYFGNCLTLVVAESTHGMLRGLQKPGFLAAARATGEAIKRCVDNGGGVLDGAEEEYLRRMKVADKRMIGVSGSPGFDQFGADFGWGGLKKVEALHIDYNGSMFLSKSKEGGVEISLSMAKLKMDAFAAVFKNNYKCCLINSNL